MRENGPLLSRLVDPPGTKGRPRDGNFPGPPKNTFCPGWSHHPGQTPFVLLSRVVASPGTKGGPPIYVPSSSTFLQPLGTILDLHCAAVVSPAPITPLAPPPSPSAVDVPHHPRAPPELCRLHAPAALDDDPARPLTGAPPSFPPAPSSSPPPAASTARRRAATLSAVHHCAATSASSSRAAALAFPAQCECGRRHFLFSFKNLCLCNSVLY